MQWLLWMIAVAALGLAAVAASGRLGSMPDTVTDTPQPYLPSGDLGAEDLRRLRFAVVPRGYSMDQVDELLDRLARQLEDQSPPASSTTPADDANPSQGEAPRSRIWNNGPQSPKDKGED